MKTLQELRGERPLVETHRAGYGRVLLSNDNQPDGQQVWVRSFEGLDFDPNIYAELQEAAHLWIHADHDRDLWRVAGVDYVDEVGADYVVLPFRTGNTTYQLAKRPDLWDDIPQFVAMRDLFQKSREARRTPRDNFFAELLTPHLFEGSLEAIFSFREHKFNVVDLCATEDDLRRWQSLRAAGHGG